MRALIISILLLSDIIFIQSQNTGFKIVGYYSMKAACDDQDRTALKYLTHVNLWFLNPDSTGRFTHDLACLKSFIDAAHKRKVKVLFSIGGGSKQPQYHWLLKSDHRTALIKNLLYIVRITNTDGIDVDLEGSDINEDYEEFVLELARELKSINKLITAAVAVYYKDKMTDNVLAAYDFVNVMAYDRTGPWRPDRPGPHSTFTHAVEDIRYFGVDRKMDKSRITLGVPFYGYGYAPNAAPISMSYKKLVKTYPQASLYDEYLLPDGKIFYYNGLKTIEQKTKFAKIYAGGIMIWQLLGDAKGKNSLLKAIFKSSKK